MPLVPHIVRHDVQQLGEALARLERVSQGLTLAVYRADEVKMTSVMITATNGSISLVLC